MKKSLTETQIERVVDKLLLKALLGSGNQKKVGDLLNRLSSEEKELLKYIKSEHFNHRII